MHRITPLLLVAAMPATALAMPSGEAEIVEASWNGPSLDRWVYPFNGSPGSRISAPTFGNTGDEQFDNRDGCLLIGFETAEQVEPGLGSASYTILSATITLEHDGQNDTLYDGTQDPWQTFLPDDHPEYQPDTDLGQPVELFGAAFRHGWTAASFLENSPHGDPFGQGVRNAHAIAFDESGEPVDVSNNVRAQFDPTPWAVGSAAITPGDLVVAGTIYTFELDVADPFIQDALREAVDAGRLRLMVTSMYRSDFDGSKSSGEYPTFYTKENPLVQVGIASAATLQLSVEIDPNGGSDPADITGDGAVDVSDLLELLASWGACDSGCGPDCAADVNNDCVVDVTDLLEVLASWSP